jgi:rhamnosyltransferase
VIDNTPGGLPVSVVKAVKDLIENRVSFSILVENHKNLGIAAAQNIGIKLARKHGFTYVLLSDQDTIFSSDTIDKLCEGHEILTEQGEQVAAIAASYMITLQNKVRRSGFIRHEYFRRHTVFINNGFIPASYVIASGCLIPVAVFDQIGLKNESFFIDWVDIEWCLRARKAGYQIFGCPDAIIYHQLGDGFSRVGTRLFTQHSPIRHYYIIRNALRLSLHSNVPNAPQRLWILSHAFVLMIFIPFFCKPRHKHFKMVMRGIIHGVKNQSGQLKI